MSGGWGATRRRGWIGSRRRVRRLGRGWRFEEVVKWSSGKVPGSALWIGGALCPLGLGGGLGLVLGLQRGEDLGAEVGIHFGEVAEQGLDGLAGLLEAGIVRRCGEVVERWGRQWEMGNCQWGKLGGAGGGAEGGGGGRGWD